MVPEAAQTIFPIDEAFDILKAWIRHTHAHDGVDKPKPRYAHMGKGDHDHRRAVERLLSIGYNGFLSGEWIKWEPYDDHLPRELATLKRYERELLRETE